jgi:hypothetical protein
MKELPNGLLGLVVLLDVVCVCLNKKVRFLK